MEFYVLCSSLVVRGLCIFNLWMDLVHPMPVARYWSEVFCDSDHPNPEVKAVIYLHFETMGPWDTQDPISIGPAANISP